MAIKELGKMKKWRFENNYTLKDAAKIFKVSYPMVWKYENGYPLSDRMEYYLNHKLDELIAEKEEK